MPFITIEVNKEATNYEVNGHQTNGDVFRELEGVSDYDANNVAKDDFYD
jgi:hypothetical protein